MVRPAGKMIVIPQYKIIVGPEEEANRTDIRYNVYVNVSDTPSVRLGDSESFSHWYPINEVGNWGFGPFYWSKKVLDHHVAQKDSILLHCHAGVCRSPAILVAWLYSKGHHKEEIVKMLGGDRFYIDHFKHLQERNCIPELAKFHKAMKENPTYSLMGILSLIDRMMEH